jgi:hypothetical protein
MANCLFIQGAQICAAYMGFSHTWRKGVEISTPFIFNRGASNLMHPTSMIDILNYHQFDDG